MTPKYDALARLLDEQPADEAVSFTFAEIDAIVGGLPPSSSGRTWWANTVRHSQSAAWLRAGRRVMEVRSGASVVFSPAVPPIVEPASDRSRRRSSSDPILDGVAVLERFVTQAGYRSIVEAVAMHTVFLHPDTVRQTDGEPLFPVVRNPFRRGEIEQLPDATNVLLDDNTSPTLAFLWASQKGRGRDVQYNHIWGDPRNRLTYTALWNLAATPAFLAKTTDGSNHPEVLSVLRYRAYELYGYHPDGEEQPRRPTGYDQLAWPTPPPPVDDLESILRARMADSPKSRPAAAARKIGWLYSHWEPDTSLLDPDTQFNN